MCIFQLNGADVLIGQHTISLKRSAQTNERKKFILGYAHHTYCMGLGRFSVVRILVNERFC